MSHSKVFDVLLSTVEKLLDQGIIIWRQPWTRFAQQNHFSGRLYQGLNVLLLASYCQLYDLDTPTWATEFMVLKNGGRIKREWYKRGPIVMYYGPDYYRCAAHKKERDELILDSCEKNGGGCRRYFKTAYHRVYNIPGMTTGIEPKSFAPSGDFKPIEAAAALWEGYADKPTLEHASHGSAFYAPKRDAIEIPKPEHFDSPEAYYATLFHEAVHSTGHESRLDRGLLKPNSGFGSDSYSREELIAEMGAAFLCGEAHIELPVLDNSAAYIATWLKRLKEDPKLLTVSAAMATKACRYIKGTYKPEADSDESAA